MIFSRADAEKNVIKNYLFGSNIKEKVLMATFELNTSKYGLENTSIVENFEIYNIFLKDGELFEDNMDNAPREWATISVNNFDKESNGVRTPSTIIYDTALARAESKFDVSYNYIESDNVGQLKVSGSVEFSRNYDFKGKEARKKDITRISYFDIAKLKDIVGKRLYCAVLIPFSANPPIIVIYPVPFMDDQLYGNIFYRKDAVIYNSLFDSKMDVHNYTLVNDRYYDNIRLNTLDRHLDSIMNEYDADDFNQYVNNDEYTVTTSTNFTTGISTFNMYKKSTRDGVIYVEDNYINYIRSSKTGKFYPINIKYSPNTENKKLMYEENKFLGKLYNDGWEFFNFEGGDPEEEQKIHTEFLYDKDEVPENVKKRFFATTSLNTDNEKELWDVLKVNKVRNEDIYVITYMDITYRINTIIYDDDITLEFILKNTNDNYDPSAIRIYDADNKLILNNFTDRIDSLNFTNHIESKNGPICEQTMIHGLNGYITKYKDRVIEIDVSLFDNCITKLSSPLYNVFDEYVFVRNEWGNLIKIDLKDYKMNLKE